MDPFIGEIKIFGGTFAPLGWNFCDGTTLDIAQNQPLYSLIGTTYGGDGVTNFKLPDLRGRIPVHRNTIVLGQVGGEETVALIENNYGAHAHPFYATTALANQPTVAGNTTAQSGTIALYTEDTPQIEMDPSSVRTIPGSGLPHDNMHPFQAINYIIALEGIYPSQN